MTSLKVGLTRLVDGSVKSNVSGQGPQFYERRKQTVLGGVSISVRRWGVAATERPSVNHAAVVARRSKAAGLI